MKESLRIKNSIEDSEKLAKDNLLYWAKVFWKDCFNIINEVSCYSEQYFVVEEFIKQKKEFYFKYDVAKELYIVGNVCSPIYKEFEKEEILDWESILNSHRISIKYVKED